MKHIIPFYDGSCVELNDEDFRHYKVSYYLKENREKCLTDMIKARVAYRNRGRAHG